MPSPCDSRQPRTHILLSPHPDDAVWSCGGRIARWCARGDRVCVVTVFDDGAPAPRGWRSIADPPRRRLEDAAALDLLGAERLSLGLPDAALREDDGTPRYESPRRLFGRAHPLDAGLGALVAEEVASLAPHGVVHAPLGLGGHVDHRIVRDAALDLDADVEWYEEFPYEGEAPAGIEPAWHEVDLEAWVAAGLCYRSQVRALLGDPAAFEAALTRRAAERGAEAGVAFAERAWTGRPVTGDAAPTASRSPVAVGR